MKRDLTAGLVLIAGLFAGTGCATSPAGSAEWKVVKSRRFTTYTKSLRNHDESLRVLEYQYAVLSSSFFKQDLGQVEVLFLEPLDFKELLGYRREFAALPRLPGQRKEGGIGSQGLIVFPRGGEWHTSGSEALAHLFIHKAMPGAPLWFHEGFAAYSRMAEYREAKGKRVACFGRPGFTSYTTYLPIERVLAASWDEYDGDEARLWYKNSARTLIDFALHADERKHAGAVGVMVRGFLAGQPSQEIIRTAFPALELPTLSDRLNRHLSDVVNRPPDSRGQCPLPFLIPDAKAPDVGDHPVNPGDSAEIKSVVAALGSLPRRDGFPAWFPEEIVARAEAAMARGSSE